MHKITVSLGNIDDAIRQIEEYEKKVQEKIKEFLTRLLEDGANIAKAKIIELKAVESSELQDSFQYTLYKEGNKGIIFTDCSHACFVEFGTGVRGSASPHPTMPWAYDSNGHGEDGWYYYDTKQGRVRFTQGMPSRPFMYETARELEQKAVEIAREVFSQ
ncbi:MAG: HK97 gp10 family phage protein [Clostridiales bacterium]|nr:HK97 gp10 family phage protein [Clostridiales bacterium]